MNDSVVIAALKALGSETKALIMVSELGARRMPSFQLRTIFNALVKDEDERRIIVDLIDKELQASGFPEEQVFGLLNDLLTVPNALQMNDAMQNTRRLRSPFAQNFEGQMPAQIGAGLDPQAAPNMAGAGAGAGMGAQYNPRSAFAAPNESQRPDQRNSQFAKRPGAPAGPEDAYQTQRSGTYPTVAQGFGTRGNPRETIAPGMGSGTRMAPGGLPAAPPIDPRNGDPRNGDPRNGDPRLGQSIPPAPATQRYSQNAFHNPEDNPAALPSKPLGFHKNGFDMGDQDTPPPNHGLPGLPGMPPVTVRPPQGIGQGLPPTTQTQRRYGMDQRLSPTAAAQAVSEAALLTPGLANISAPLASKIVSRTDGSPNNFQGGASATAPNRNSDGRPIILIADDDKRIRMVFRLRMEESGLTVVECADGTEAWNRIQQGDITLAVLDMKMPGLHGLEVLSRMADKQFRIPVIVCSAYDQLKDEFVVQTYPRLRYLVKPVAPEQLVGSIKELLLKPA